MVSNCLFKRNSVYYFRLNIPQDIAPYFSCREIWKSLRTNNYKSAKITITKLLYVTEQLFLHVRSGMYSDIQIRQLVKDYLHAYLNRCESIRSIAMVKYKGEEQEQILGATDAQVIVDTSVSAIDVLIESSKRKLLLNDFTGISVRIDWFLKAKDLEIDKGSVEYTTLCREILKAEIEALKVERERMSGNYDNQYDKFLENTIEPVVQSASVASVVSQEVESSPVVTLSQVMLEHVKEAELGGKWSEKTISENSGIYKLFLDVLGDVDIQIITHQAMMQFREKLSRLPANRDKKAQFKGKSIEQLLAMKNVEPINRATLNKYLVRASTLFRWAVRHGYITANVAEGLTLPKSGRADQQREAYSNEDIKKIIDQLNYDKNNPHRFWIPLIGMYQGMRLDEICQLYISDIVVIDEVPCISVNSDADKKLKNDASERIIPIHPMLIRRGFLGYVEELRKQKQTRLWERLVNRRDGYSTDYGKWYQNFNRKYITTNPKRVFHSFRHSLANGLKQAGVQETLIAGILGHSIGSVTNERYGKRFEPKPLLAALTHLDYGIDMPA